MGALIVSLLTAGFHDLLGGSSWDNDCRLLKVQINLQQGLRNEVGVAAENHDGGSSG